MPAIKTNLIDGTFLTHPAKFIQNNDSRAVDRDYDYRLADGRYAYIAMVADPGASSSFGLIRQKDVNKVADPDLGTAAFHLAYTRAHALPGVAKELKAHDFALVTYDREFMIRSNDKDSIPCYNSPKGLTVTPLELAAKENPDLVWEVYQHHMRKRPGALYGPHSDDDGMAVMMFNKNTDEYPSAPSDLRDRANIASNIIYRTAPAYRDKVKKATKEGMGKKFDPKEIELGEPVLRPVPIPYIPTQAEADAMWQPGYMRIGYASLMIPPEQIIYTREQPIESKQVMRAHGSNKRGYGHSSKEFQIQLSITDGPTVNGVLLPIIRQFMKTPFVPVENELLNDTYDVQALTLEAVQVSTVPGYPNTLDVTITASEFNWRAYMPGEYDLDSTYCYPLYKVWCEDITSTDTRPLGWRSDADWMKRLKLIAEDPNKASLPAAEMNGGFTMYLPDEKYLAELEELGQMEYDEIASFMLLQADAANVSLAEQFATKEGFEKILKEHGPQTNDGELRWDYAAYPSLSVGTNYEGDINELVLQYDRSGEQFTLYDHPVSVMKVTDRRAAKQLMLQIADSIEMHKRTPHSIPNPAPGGYVPPSVLWDGGSNPFEYGMVITDDNGAPVSQSTKIQNGGHMLNGKVMSAESIRHFVKETLESAIAGGPTKAGADADAKLARTYFVIPRKQAGTLKPVRKMYEKQAKAVAAAREKLRERQRVIDVPSDLDTLIEKGYWVAMELPSFVIEQITVGAENLIASLMPQMQDSPTHQFLGRADATVVVRGTITDQTDVDRLREILDLQEHLTRRYGGVQMAAPFSKDGTGGYGGYMLIVNEICRLLGVTHAIPMRANIVTSKDYPGTFDVELVFTQFNLMQQMDAKPKSLNNENWYATANGPKSAEGAPVQVTNDSYYEHVIRAQHFHEKLRTMELYPDMKLPTFLELLHWCQNLANDDLAKWAKFLAGKGIVPSKFNWSNTDCRPLGQIKFPKPSPGDDTETARAFADPDFYSAPSFPTGKDYVDGILSTLSGNTNRTGGAKWTLPDKEIGPEVMHLRDRQRLSGALPFKGDMKLVDDSELSSVKTKYEGIRLPEFTDTGDVEGYSLIAPEQIRNKMSESGFSKSQFTAIEKYARKLKVPPQIAYTLFSYEGAAGQTDGKAAAARTKGSYGIGQTQHWAIDEVNAAIKNGTLENPWPGHVFTLADRADAEKAAFISLVYLKNQHDGVVKKLKGKKYDESHAWAYANVCYVRPNLVNSIDPGEGVGAAGASLPETDSGMKSGSKKHANPLKKRYETGLTMMGVKTWDLAKAGSGPSQPVTPKLQTLPAMDSNATASKTNVTWTDVTTGVSTSHDIKYDTMTASDRRQTTWFIIGRKRYSAENHSLSEADFFHMNVYMPTTKKWGISEIPGYELNFLQKTNEGTKERKLVTSQAITHADPDGKGPLPSEDGVFFDESAKEGYAYYPVAYNKDDWEAVKSKQMTHGEYIKRHFMNANDLAVHLAEVAPQAGAPQVTLGTSSTTAAALGPKHRTIGDMFLREDGRDMFYDMRYHTGFGRLIQAFPSYCILLVDGGRWLRYWRLYDHLFGMTAVESIEVAKSRKTPTDVASVTFANMYGHLSKQPAETKQGKVFSWSLPMVIGAFQDSIMNTSRQDAEVLTRWRMHAKSLLLKPGTRLHIRMGYGSNAAALPAVFNGVISEVSPGPDSMQVVALGDGVELEKKLEPNATNSDGNMVYRSHALLGAGTTPRELILGVMAPTNFVEIFTVGGYDHNNPHGIEHYGSPTYYFMSKDVAEVGMNVYEASSAALKQDCAEIGSTAFGSAVKGLNIIPGYGMIDGDYNNFVMGVSMEDASAWEVFTTCRRSVPEFILASHPFGLRSTLFYGKPHWPLRFNYANAAISWYDTTSGGKSFLEIATTDETGKPTLVEFADGENVDLDVVTLWKPFSQMRIISSTYNLISNQIRASDADVYTICQATGSHNGLFTPDKQNNDWSNKVFLDTDIYPEHQKILYVPSGLYSTGTQRFLDAVRDFNTANLLFTRKVGNTYAINALRDSVMDMYQGQAVIVGDPTIKPHDLAFFADTRAEMSGLFRVKEVTHHLSFETGLVTTVTPDLLASMTDYAEQMAWSWIHQFGHRFAGALGLQYMIGSVAARRANPIALLAKLKLRLLNYSGQKAPWINEAVDKVDELQLKMRDFAGEEAEKLSDYLLKPEVSQGFDKFHDEIKELIKSIGKIAEDAEKQGFVSKRIVSPIINKLDNLRDVWKIEHDAAAASKVIGRALQQRDFAAVAAELRTLKELQIVKVLGKRGALAATAARLGKLSVYMLAVDSLLEWVNRKLAYRQCLVLRPLQLNNKEFSAGINGHLGCVVGDPDGYWDGVIQSLTNWNYNMHKKDSVYYSYNGSGQATENFGDMSLGIVSVFAAAAGIRPVDYGNKSAEDIDQYLFGEGTMSEDQRNLHYSNIQKHLDRVYRGDVHSRDALDQGINPTGSSLVSDPSDPTGTKSTQPMTNTLAEGTGAKVLETAKSLVGQSLGDNCWTSAVAAYARAGVNYRCVYSIGGQYHGKARNVRSNPKPGDLLQIKSSKKYSPTSGEHNVIFVGWEGDQMAVYQSAGGGRPWEYKLRKPTDITVIWEPVAK